MSEAYPHAIAHTLAEICFQHGVRTAILSPGSRVAPLAIAFARHDGIAALTISDERSAAYIALGAAQASQHPVVIACTSGTAALNYGPAIAEAYYQQVPLIVLTADRPPEWVDQQDGQTIRQVGLYQNHIRWEAALPADATHPDADWHAVRLANEALLAATRLGNQGPVHLNCPFREPLYPPAEAQPPAVAPRIIRAQPAQQLSSYPWPDELAAAWQKAHRIVIIAGQSSPFSAAAQQRLSVLASEGVVVFGEVISNLTEVSARVTQPEAILGALPEKRLSALAPDVVITAGQPILSKQLKRWLRQYPAQHHWHIQPEGQAPDVFQHLTTVIATTLEAFLAKSPALAGVDTSYQAHWSALQAGVEQAQRQWLAANPFGELPAVAKLLGSLPAHGHLHLANSMTVRYANFWGLPPHKVATVWANRGTSGIDGCLSTAVGHALARPEALHVLITGDLAFFYDRNAFWHNYLERLGNLKILLLNNHGGVIFRMIDGPRQQPELEEFFATRQRLSAAGEAHLHGLGHFAASDADTLHAHWGKWLAPSSRPAILEVQTEQMAAQQQLTGYKAFLAESVARLK